MAKSKQGYVSHASNYFYNNGSVLKNKYGITDFKELQQRCHYDATRAMEFLYDETLPERFDSQYLTNIHKTLFGNTYEWAGRTREVPTILRDGTTAVMAEIQTGEDGLSHAVSIQVENGLRDMSQKLADKNNLKGLSREDFIDEVTDLMTSLYRIRPFVDGNKRTSNMFLEKLSEAAGHELDFSLVTKERMETVCKIAVKHGDKTLMKEMLSDMLHPQKAVALGEFMQKMQNTVGDDIHKYLVLGVKDGMTYEGIYQGCGEEGFALKTKTDLYVVAPAGYLTPEQRKTLQPGDKITFTAPMEKDLSQVFIPAEKAADLTKDQVAEKVSQDVIVKAAKETVRYFSNLVYNKPSLFDNKMDIICRVPGAGSHLADQIENSPRSFGRLAGINFCGFQSSRRQEAVENIGKLRDAFQTYVTLAGNAKKEILEAHQTKQARCGQAVEMPSKMLRSLLSVSQETQQATLAESPSLQKELNDFMKKINNRLTQEELKAARNKNYGQLISSMGISKNKAKEIATIADKAQKACNELQKNQQQEKVVKLQRPRSMSMAS
ncbi:BID domain-containing T4SS effector [Bartonella sp. F02]|uniref:BID domain-containing T4SS effector n=1 Tax=Bartonella sp. F02 TaxID=2967262 RepID=UPI0022A9BEAB|nr:BID domain-containing T4SS effector [Bartonella sp. F02]MCZ2328930.1 BID domain-containing T4SS effector [Bartonella sp. F02]